MNVLKPHLRITVATLLRGGASQREIERMTGVDRKTIRRMARDSNSPGVATGSDGSVGQIPPPWPPADTPAPTVTTKTVGSISACEAHRSWIEAQVQLGRNAVSIYQDLVEAHGFAHRYNAVKRFVARLRPTRRAHVGEIDFAVFSVASDHAGLKGIALSTDETAHTNGTTPFGDLDVFGFEVVRGEDGGFGK